MEAVAYEVKLQIGFSAALKYVKTQNLRSPKARHDALERFMQDFMDDPNFKLDDYLEKEDNVCL